MGHLTTCKSSFKFHTNSDDQRQSEPDLLDKAIIFDCSCEPLQDHVRTHSNKSHSAGRQNWKYF